MGKRSLMVHQLMAVTIFLGTWLGHVIRGQRVSVTMVAVHMGVEETGMQTGHRGTYNWPPSQE